MSELKNIPKHWEIKTLEEVCAVVTDGTHKTPKYIDTGIPFISIANIQPFAPISYKKYTKFISEEEHKILSKRAKAEKDDILFPRIGTLGYAKRVDWDYEVSIFVGLGLAKPKREIILPKYLEYYMNTQEVNKYSIQNANGSGRMTLPLEASRMMPVPLPPLPEQLAIVSRIEALLSELENGKQQLLTAQQQLKVYRQSLLKWAFEGRLTNEGVKEGVLPEGWKWVKIEDVAFSLDNRRKPINKNERLKRVGNIPYYGANGRVGWIDDFIFDEPLVCVVEDETFSGRQIPFSYKISGKTWVNNHAHVLKAKSGTSIDFLNYQLAYYPFLPLTTGTTGRKKLTKNALMSASFKICPIEEQHRIVSELESKLTICDNIEATIGQSLRQAETLRQSILKRAFEGKLV